MDVWSICEGSRAQLQGFYSQLLIDGNPNPLAKIECGGIASTRRIWLPETREQAVGLLREGKTPIHGHVEKF